MLRSLVVVTLAQAFTLPAGAADTLAERQCKLLTDQVTARLQAGDIEGQKRHLPQLRRCQAILKAALDRQSKEILEDYNSRAWSHAPPRHRD